MNLVLSLVVFVILVSITNCARVPRDNNNSKRCSLPKHPTNGRWSIPGSNPSPGTNVSNGVVISVRCNDQYRLSGSSVIKCKNGKWSSKIGQCLELCPPIIENSAIKVNCTLNGKISDCKKPTNNIIATIQCAPFYENAELNRNPFRICKNGKWNQEIPLCTPVCGIKPKASKKSETKSYYPWNIGVFRKREEIEFKCAGTLITEKAVLTAATCITDEFSVLDSIKDFYLAAGKSTDMYRDPKDPEAQYSKVKDMFVPNTFQGSTKKYLANIAVMIASDPFTMTKRIQPACFDWTNKYQKEFEVPKITGTVAGPVKSQYYPKLKEVIEVDIPLINDTECYNLLGPQTFGGLNYESLFATNDKYCSSYINKDRVPECRIDRGVGLISKNSFNEKYYITGVFTIAPAIHREDCDNKKWLLFTRVYDYISNFIVEKVNLYTPINRAHFQTSCGIKSVQAQTLIVNGKNVTKGDYPWQVAIYKITDSTKILICGGSLINQRVILTAAHCVTDLTGNILPKGQYIVAVGKYYRNFDDPRDKNSQVSALKDIFVPSEYRGELQNYIGDLAILISETSFHLSRDIQPVCVDWEGKYENQFLKPSVTGYVAGWGFTQENQNPSEELKDLEVPYIEPEKCRNVLPTDYEIYLTSDKLCSGFLNEGKAVCNGDSGGGLVFKNRNDDRYYLAGIVSLSPQAPTGGCDSQQYALYTRASKYINNFVLDKVRLYWA